MTCTATIFSPLVRRPILEAINCGYQGGEEFMNNYQEVEQEITQVPCASTIIIPITGTPLSDCSNVPQFLPVSMASTSTSDAYGDWSSFLSQMGMSDFLSAPSTPLLTSSYLQSLSWGAMTQSAVQQSCKAASQAITAFERKNKGAPVPPTLLLAAASCAQVVMPVH